MLRDELEERVMRHSIALNPSLVETPPDDIFIVRSGDPLGPAFETARAHGRPVRLVGHGVTCRPSWPEWASAGQHPILLTELGAYRIPTAASESLRRRYRDWMDYVFAPVSPKGGSPADIHYPVVCLRLFQRVFNLHMLLAGVSILHPAANVRTLGMTAGGIDEDALFGGTEESALREAIAAAAIPPLVIGAWIAACAFTVREWIIQTRASASTRKWIAEHRQRQPKAEPELWIACITDWERVNKHLMHAVALPELAAHGLLGVLLTGTLRPGLRGEHLQRAQTGTEQTVTGLGALSGHLQQCVIGQGVHPMTGTEVARKLAWVLPRSAQVIGRMLRRPEPIRGAARWDGFFATCTRTALAATLDTTRAVFAEHATRDFVKEHDVRGKTVVLVTANAAETTSVNYVLREAGATTVEHNHGCTSGYWHGAVETFTTIRCVWTEADAREITCFPHQKAVVAGMPTALKLAPRRITDPRKLLILSNYVHRDWNVHGRFPAEPFLHELLRVSRLITGYDIRWRPHPADAPEACDRAMAKVTSVEISRGRPLEEDLDWCDVLIAGQSTALVEAILAGVTTFAHVTPEYEDTLSYMSPDRTFFRAEDFVPKLERWAAAIRRGDPWAHEAEEFAKTKLWGPTKKPVSLREGLALTQEDDGDDALRATA